MISNHYPMTYGHELNWLVLLIIVLITAAARQYFVLRHHHVNRPVILGALSRPRVLAVWMAPQPVDVPDDQPLADLAPRAHASFASAALPVTPPAHGRGVHRAPGGVMLDTPEQMVQWAPRIRARSIDSHDMPFMNKTGMTDAERAISGTLDRRGRPCA
jgi:uncharacterized membrane protein